MGPYLERGSLSVGSQHRVGMSSVFVNLLHGYLTGASSMQYRVGLGSLMIIYVEGRRQAFRFPNYQRQWKAVNSRVIDLSLT